MFNLKKKEKKMKEKIVFYFLKHIISHLSKNWKTHTI